jgi:hypothetical protein
MDGFMACLRGQVPVSRRRRALDFQDPSRIRRRLGIPPETFTDRDVGDERTGCYPERVSVVIPNPRRIVRD